MHNLIDQLHLDHINFSKVLNLLTQQYELICSEEAPDYVLTAKILDYIHNYPDRIHHPMENAIFKEFLKTNTEIQEKLSELMREHQEITQMTHHLKEIIDGILDGALISKEELIQQLNHYIERQRCHIDTEESHVFPVLQEKLNSIDLQRVTASLSSKDDPLFGESVKQGYEALYRLIIDLD